MFRNLIKIKIMALVGVLLAVGFIGGSQAEARTSKAFCKTVRTIVFADKSKIEAKRTAYTKCSRFNKEPWKILSKKVRCRGKGKGRHRIYRCQCFARICKLRGAKKPAVAKQKEAAAEVKKETAPVAKKEAAPVMKKAVEPEIKRVVVKPAVAPKKEEK